MDTRNKYLIEKFNLKQSFFYDIFKIQLSLKLFKLYALKEKHKYYLINDILKNQLN